MPNSYLVLIRHGQSEWNKKSLFTGWVDVGLSEQGKIEAQSAGQELKKKQLVFDILFSSALKRAIQTMEIVLEQMDLTSLPVTKAWELNERHYGALQGQNRQDIIKKYGADQVHQWRRSFKIKPPPLKQNQVIEKTGLYKTLRQVPNGESLEDTQKRVLPYWEQKIFPYIQSEKSVLLSAHGNSLRALIKKLENISDENISSLEIKTGRPLIYKLDKKANILSKEILNF